MIEARDKPASILLIAPAWVGDMVMAHALIQRLAGRYRGVRIHVVAPAATEPLAARMSEVASASLLPVGHGELGLGRRYRLARALREEGFDQAIVLPNTWKSALLPALAGVPRRTGWHGESRHLLLNDRRRLDEVAYPLMVERFMALGFPPGESIARPYPVPRLAVDENNRSRLLDELRLNGPGSVLALCPGAEFGPAKRWPAGYYAEVARAAGAGGWRVWLLGSPGERDTCDRICALAPQAVNLAGRTRLLDAVDLLSAADAVVSNDSGLMHVAGAVGARVVAVFGSTSPEFTPPAGNRARVLALDLPCSPCFQRTCPLGHMRCLNDLPPARIVEALGLQGHDPCHRHAATESG